MAGLFYACFLRGLIVSLLSDLSGFVFYCVVVSSQNDWSIGIFFRCLKFYWLGCANVACSIASILFVDRLAFA